MFSDIFCIYGHVIFFLSKINIRKNSIDVESVEKNLEKIKYKKPLVIRTKNSPCMQVTCMQNQIP